MNRLLMPRLVITALVVSALAIVAGPVAPAQDAGNAVEIKMTAKKYRFDPNEVTVKKGQHVKLLITALDRDHGFKLEAFNINQKLKKGETETIEFDADKTGTFPFQCSEFCGLGHGKMKGKLVVEE